MKYHKLELNNNKLLKLQGPEVHINNNTSLDRYGFSYLLAKRLGIHHPRRPFCNWMHGWYYWDDIMKIEDIIGNKNYSKNISIIVSSQLEKLKLLHAGYTNVKKGGLPFAYVKDQGVQRNSHAMLAFIGHSSESENLDVIDLNYLDYLESQREKFEEIYVSIYSLDRKKSLINQITKRRLIPHTGANPFDRRSLVRTRIALEYCEHVSTNTFGSHVAYALAAGCRTAVFAPCYKYDTSKFLGTVHSYSDEYVERMEHYTSESYLRSRWNFLFDRISDEGYYNKDLGLEWIGEKYKLSNNKLKIAVGWNLGAQITGYIHGAIRRINRNLKKI